uniref:Uncharacterized protein n=1 Tax=Rhizophagus irregularis (strain DAOM 181602 / DAOM 197198 / MUCL 43194) TaxID=747089 RepID=U9TKG8_RHIID
MPEARRLPPVHNSIQFIKEHSKMQTHENSIKQIFLIIYQCRHNFYLLAYTKAFRRRTSMGSYMLCTLLKKGEKEIRRKSKFK